MDEQYSDGDDLAFEVDPLANGNGSNGKMHHLNNGNGIHSQSDMDEEDGGAGETRSMLHHHTHPHHHTNGNTNKSSSSSSSVPAVRGGSFTSHLLSATFAEFFSTFFLTFLGLSTIYASNLVGDDALSTGSLLYISLGYGFSYGTLVYIFSLNAGGYLPPVRQMNPALTVALWMMGKVDWIKAGVMVVAQILGAILGTGLVYLCFDSHSLRIFELYDGTNFTQQLLLSAIVSFLFIFVLLITNYGSLQPILQSNIVGNDESEQSPQSVHELNSLISCLTACITTAVATPLTGCFCNPLFGLAVLNVSHWYNSWIVVLVGPLLGAILASLTARLFSYRTRPAFVTRIQYGDGTGMKGIGVGIGLGDRSNRQQQQRRTNGAVGAPGGLPTLTQQMRTTRSMEEKQQGSRF